MWPWVAAVGAIVALVGVGIVLLGDRGGNSWQPWDVARQSIADDFPELVAATDGGSGFSDLTCETAPTEAGQQAKFRCADAEFGVSIIDYGDAETRDSYLPQADSFVVLGTGSCEVESYEIPNQAHPTFMLAPQGANSQYILLVNGEDAEDRRLTLPVC
ncbi:hypothetical protein [Corynebacterium cystitidis]|uniref:hypothetical protein n=1 Tax=Corynebacterium cystitidis TaxID=35757 RepID=UPI00211DD997|nr:hypothetical protein [Corynebacterium cystitidis]